MFKWDTPILYLKIERYIHHDILDFCDSVPRAEQSVQQVVYGLWKQVCVCVCVFVACMICNLIISILIHN